jgi:DNA-binding CsgD family transcriptional regulator
MATDLYSGPSRDAPKSRPICTMAQVDLGSSTTKGPTSDRVHLFQSALRRLEQTVRANDQICPFGLTRIAIVFGPDAQAVTTRSLGERLARSLAFGLATEFGDPRTRGGSEPSARRRGAPGQSPGPLRRTGDAHRASTVVTVDRLLGEQRRLERPEVTTREPAHAIPVGAPRIRHRAVVQYPSNTHSGHGRHEPSTDGRRAVNAGTLLVIDPNPSTPGTAGLAAQAAVATSERLGFQAEALATKPDEPFDLGCLEAQPDLVVLVVGAEQAGQVPEWSESTWCIPAGLTSGFVSLGIDVLTVSAGAGAGALVGCYEQGATILFNLDALPAELHFRRRHLGSDRSSGVDPNGGRLPHRFEALLQLTASERRVLFYLTTGMSAQEIADVQVVSLTTVRSHIRSILRKLGVRSQLAAVVCANSRDLGRIQPLVTNAERGSASRKNAG